MSDEHKRTGVQGWRNFRVARDRMLAHFDAARTTNHGKPVQVAHGIAAERAVRSWLDDFLPKRYGVTSGFIVSSKLPDTEPLRHYDVIIYDALDSPVLWVEAEQGADRVQAIPAEHVRAVFEVKAKLTRRSASEAVGKLEELRVLLSNVDNENERYPAFLPRNFWSCIVFFDLERDSAAHIDILDTLLRAATLRGFYGGLVLRASELGRDESGSVKILQNRPADAVYAPESPRDGSLFGSFPRSEWVRHENEGWLAAAISWSPSAFTHFAFDTVALLAGTFDAHRISSMHGMSWVG